MSEAIYNQFAAVYDAGPYREFSQTMAVMMPLILARCQAQPRRLLDLCCGTGDFTVAMAKRGFEVIGVDQSAAMLAIARARATESGVTVSFLQQDIRQLALDQPVDFATCWFDSLNYILEELELRQVFRNVAACLNSDGRFVFDMNTIYGLATSWDTRTYVQQDTEAIFEIHRAQYDHEAQVAMLTVTCFVRQGEGYRRFREIHRERGYRLETVAAALEESGLTVLERFTGREFAPPTPQAGRVFFITQKTRL